MFELWINMSTTIIQSQLFGLALLDQAFQMLVQRKNNFKTSEIFKFIKLHRSSDEFYQIYVLFGALITWLLRQNFHFL